MWNKKDMLMILSKVGGIASLIAGVLTTFILPFCDKADRALEQIEMEEIVDKKIDERLANKES